LKYNNKKSTDFSMLPKKSIQVACALIFDRGKVLIARRAKGRPHEGSWEFPGGKIRESESPEDAIVREIREELSITVQPEKRLTSAIHEYATHTVALIAFICSVKEGKARLMDHDKVRWVDPTKDLNVSLLPPDRVIWEELKKTISHR